MSKIDLRRARAHWYVQQGLAGPMDATPVEVVERTGWLRTLGGADVYLALRSRLPALKRIEVDAAVGAGRLRLSPAVRGCIYLVPERDHALALRTADVLSRRRTARDLEKVGVEDAEIAAAGEAVVEALEAGPMTTRQVRAAVPDEAVRSLGEVGKKIGMSSTLPVTLRTLEFAGRIERVPLDDRLDHEQYVWRRPAVAPALDGLPDDAAGLAGPLAEVFFGFAGPATLDEFVKWTGLTKGAAQKGMKAAGLVEVAIAGYAESAWVRAGDRAALEEAVEVEGGVALLNFADNYLAVRSTPAAFADEAHAGRAASSWGRGQKPLGEAAYLHARAVLDGDRLAGSWAWDPDAEAVVAEPFDDLAPARAEALAAAAASLTAFLKDEVGHARSTSIDTAKSQRQRLALVKARGAL